MSADAATGNTEWTLSRLLAWTSEHLAERGVDESRLAAEVLLAHAADCRRIDLYARFEDVLDAERLARFRDLVVRAAKFEPVAYLVGEREFYSLAFRVTPDVLIPRPETETLVEAVIDHCHQASLDAPRLLDLGTGSGCVAVALLRHLPNATCVATDVSAAALAVAKENAERHGVLDRLTLVEADRLALPCEVIDGGAFDVMVSNPPYVTAAAMDILDSTVRDYEPHDALTDHEDGLSFYRNMATDAPAMMVDGGMLAVEVGDDQAEDVRQTLCASGVFIHKKTIVDRVVGAPRVVLCSVDRSAADA